MALINDEIGYIGGIPGPGKVYVAGVGYVNAPAQQGTYVAGVGYVTPEQVAKAAGQWTCECGASNSGKFCLNCGKAKPAPKEEWTCSCGAKNIGKFCSECGKTKPEEWTCSCGHKNIGKFCNECGKAKPEEWTCSCGHKNSGKFCSECGGLNPAEKTKIVAPVMEETPVVVETAPAPVVEEVKPEPVVEAAPVEPDPQAAPGSWVCPACGDVNTTKFCQTCGMKQPEDASTPEVVPVAAPIVEEIKPEPAPAPVVEEVKPEPVVETAPVEVVPQVAPGSWVCPACGEVNTTKFCQTCGMKQPEGASVPEVAPVVVPIVEEVKPEPAPAPVVEEVKPEPVVEAAPVEPAPQAAPGSWVCPACGEVNTTKFCQTCGTKQP